MKVHGTSPVSGGRVAFQIDGPRHGPALLLLPGQANSHRWWVHVRPLFTGRFFTVTFDYRGTGETAALGNDNTRGPAWSIRLFADDAAAVLRSLGIREALVYGTSMGGRVAQELALAHPDAVRRLVLACTSPGGAVAHERDDAVKRSLVDPDPVRRRRAIVDLFYTPSWVRAYGGYDQVPGYLFGDPTMSREAAHRHLQASAAHDASGRLPSIQAPTLILHGDADLMAPVANAAVLGAGIPHNRVEVVAGGRHGFFDEFAERVTSTVTAFLES